MTKHAPASQLFSPHLLARHRQRAAECVIHDDVLYSEMAHQLLLRTHEIRRQFNRVLTLGYFGQNVDMSPPWRPDVMVSDCFIDHPSIWHAHAKRFPAERAYHVKVDEAHLPFAPHSFDCILSCLHLHWVQELPMLLHHIKNLLTPDGVFLAVLWGGETLNELRQALTTTELSLSGGAAMRVAPMATTYDMAILMQQAGFALPVVDTNKTTLMYSGVRPLIQDLRCMGETSALHVQHAIPNRKQFFTAVETEYKNRWGQPDGQIPATFQAIFLTGWGPSSSQPKALRPGSAQHSLIDALK